MKIDVFNHVFPTEFFEAAEKLMPATAVKRWKAMDELYDMDARMRVLDKFDDYQQIISISQPPFDLIAGPGDSPELARVAKRQIPPLPVALCIKENGPTPPETFVLVRGNVHVPGEPVRGL